MPENCTVPAHLLPELLEQFDNGLSHEEEEQVIQMFDQYLFYHSLKGRERLYLCTSCGDVWTDRAGKSHPGHNALWRCPRCGARVTMKAAGKLTGLYHYPTLHEEHNVVFLRAAEDGGLMISAGRVIADYVPGALCGYPLDEEEHMFPTPTLEYWEKRRYWMKPGELASWKQAPKHGTSECPWNWHNDTRYWTWESTVSAGEPNPKDSFYSRQPDDGCYKVVGWDALEASEMRYSGVTDYFDPEKPLFRGLVSYLARYTRRPQLEMLVKLRYDDIVDRMIFHDDLSGKYVDWKAATPHGFFRLSKPVFRAWNQMGGRLGLLELFQTFPDNMSAKAMQSAAVAKAFHSDTIHRVKVCAKEHGLELLKVLCWLGTADRAQLWVDYLSIAKQLQYDLARADVLMPKDLRQRHDNAVAQRQVIECEEQQAAYEKLRRQLERKYAMEFEGMVVLVPPCAQDIINEGKALQHCVGGYADRHVKGRTVILFLRCTENVDKPLVTIEINGTEIVQVHGFANDRGKASPRTVYKAFFDTWLGWLKGGSPRDGQGRPILPMQEEVKTA